jgi:acid phosphatase (class A)
MALRHGFHIAALALGASLLASAGHAADILPAGQIDPARLLPPPPSAAVRTEELAELRLIQAHATPERLKQARWDDQHQNWHMYEALLGAAFDMDKLPATARVLDAVNHEMVTVSNKAKAYFKRPRPWSLDAALNGCPHKPDDNPLTSYPSGHTLYAFSVGTVLADLMPDKAGPILDRARDFAYSRLVCGVHYRSDTVAGEVLGTVIGHDFLDSPQTQADLAAARAELKRAGLAGG